MSLTKSFRVSHKFQPAYSALIEWKGFNDDAVLLENGTIVSLDSDEKNSLKNEYTKAIDGYGCIGTLKFANSNGTRDLILVIITSFMSVGKLLNSEIFRITGVSFVSLQDGSIDNDSRCSDVKRLVSSGKFYFAWSPNKDNIVDLTTNFQKAQTANDGEFNKSYFWNHLMHLHFKHFGIPCEKWLFRLMCGGIDIKTVYIGAQQAKAVVISRLSCDRAGTRYHTRGIDDNGNVANFVESEQVIIIGDKISSFMQVRGSVPLFWGQPGLNVGSHKVKMFRGFEASSPAFERHLNILLHNYGKFAIVNLLGNKEGESNLSNAFQDHHLMSIQHDQVPMFCFDYHVECKGGKWDNLSKLYKNMSYLIKEYNCFATCDGNTELQTGVFRVNCLDCLDRTNSVQTYFGLQMIRTQLEKLGFADNKQLEDRFKEAFKSVWPQTGDLISRMYAGTGALEGKVKLKDGARSMTRAIQNNFLDQNKQNAINILSKGVTVNPDLYFKSRTLVSNEYLHVSSSMLQDMCNMYQDYTYPAPMKVFIGTWNVNGGKHFRSIAYKNEKLEDWVLDGPKIKYGNEGEEYVAIYDYDSQEDGDLCFATNDVISVHETLEDGQWFRGELNGKTGIFPSNYVSKVLPKYTALFDFPSQQEGDLEFAKDDIIEVSKSVGEWWEGKVITVGKETGQTGIFPASFVKKMKTEGGDDNNEENSSNHHNWNEPIDIFAIGFEEMVELSAGNIVNTSHSNQQAWGIELQKTISRDYKYIQITSEQLVGVCLYIFTRPQHAPHIKNVEVGTVKTGMGGATGNKGGIGVSMQFYNSSLCFVCSHLAAGQAEVKDRNNDFTEICKRMTFSNNRSLFAHDYVFWCGDLNYRIEMTTEEVKTCVAAEDWDSLYEFDQLNQQRTAGNTFQNFNEGRLEFPPTYKYDLFSDDYDTSEKARVPAWTDRVLWYNKNENSSPTLLYYGRAELKTSDHRPVSAILNVNILQTDDAHLDIAFKKALYNNGPLDCSVLVSYPGDLKDDDSYKAIIETLSTCGDVKLTRYLGEKLLVIFTSGSSAVNSSNLSGTEILGYPIQVELKSPDWASEIEREVHGHAINDMPLNDESYMLEMDGGHNVSKYEYEQDDDQIDEENTEQCYDNTTPTVEDKSPIVEENNNQYYTDTDYAKNDIAYDDNNYETQEEASYETYDHSADQGWACEDIYKSMPDPVYQPQTVTEYYQTESMPDYETQTVPVKPPPPTRRQKPKAPPRPAFSPVTPDAPAPVKKPPPRPSTVPSVSVGPPTKPPPPLNPPILPSPLTPTSAPQLPPPITARRLSSPLTPTKPPVPTPAARKPKRMAPAPPPKPPAQPIKLPPALPKAPPKGPPAASLPSTYKKNEAFVNNGFDCLLDAPIHSVPDTNQPLIPLSNNDPFGDLGMLGSNPQSFTMPNSKPPNFTLSSMSKPQQPSSLLLDDILLPQPAAPTVPSNPPLIPNRASTLPPKQLNNDPWSTGISNTANYNGTVPNSFSTDFSKFSFNS